MNEFPADIDNRRILPFLERSEIVASGGFGDVFRVKIFPLLQEFVPTAVGLTLPDLSLWRNMSVWNYNFFWSIRNWY